MCRFQNFNCVSISMRHTPNSPLWVIVYPGEEHTERVHPHAASQREIDSPPTEKDKSRVPPSARIAQPSRRPLTEETSHLAQNLIDWEENTSPATYCINRDL